MLYSFIHTLAITTMIMVTKSAEYFENEYMTTEKDFSSLENFKKSFHKLTKHRFSGLEKAKTANVLATTNTDCERVETIYSFTPYIWNPILFFYDNGNNRLFFNLNFDNQLSTLNMPALIYHDANFQKSTPEFDEIFDNILTTANNHKCHSFVSDDYKCFFVGENERNQTLYMRVSKTYNFMSEYLFFAMPGFPKYDEKTAVEIPFGLAYLNKGRDDDQFLLRNNTIGLAVVKKNGKLANNFLEVTLRNTKKQYQNFKIKSIKARRVIMRYFSNLRYDITKFSFEIGVKENINNYEISTTLKHEQKNNKNKTYINIDRFSFGGSRTERIKKMQYDPNFPGYGLPKAMIEQMIRSSEYEIKHIGGRYYKLYMNTDDEKKAVVTIGGKNLELIISDSVAIWTKKHDKKELKAIILIESIPENDTVVLGYLAIRRYDIFVDVAKSMIGFSLVN